MMKFKSRPAVARHFHLPDPNPDFGDNRRAREAKRREYEGHKMNREEEEAMEKLRVYLVEDCGGDASLVDGWFATIYSTKNHFYYHSKEDPLMKVLSRQAVARHFHLPDPNPQIGDRRREREAKRNEYEEYEMNREEEEAMEKLRVYLVEDCGGDGSLVDGWFATKLSTTKYYKYHSKEDPTTKFSSRRAVARHFHL
jgi:predicted  nucleic acid-binding Zn-ribbon protein